MQSIVSSKYQVVIPVAVRRVLGLRKGQRVFIGVLGNDTAVLTKRPVSITKALAGLGSELWQKLGGANQYIKQERSTWQKR